MVSAAMFILCATLTIGGVARGADDSRSAVIVNDGMLSVSASDVPLGSLLDEVAQKAKIEVHVADEVKSVKVSSRFSDLSLKDGLIRILDDADQNTYLLVYKDREQKVVSQLFVLKSQGASSGSASAPSGHQPNNRNQLPSEAPGVRMSPPIMPTVPPPTIPQFPPQEGQDLPQSFPPPGSTPGESGGVPSIPMPEPVPPRDMNNAVPPPMP